MSEAGVTQGAPHPEGLCPELASTSDRDKHAAASPGITTYCEAPFPAGQRPPEFAILPPSDQTLCLHPSTERYDANPTILRIRYLLIAADDAFILHLRCSQALASFQLIRAAVSARPGAARRQRTGQHLRQCRRYPVAETDRCYRRRARLDRLAACPAGGGDSQCRTADRARCGHRGLPRYQYRCVLLRCPRARPSLPTAGQRGRLYSHAAGRSAARAGFVDALEPSARA